MEHDFWYKIWRENTIPFHQGGVQAALHDYFPRLQCPKGGRVFVPLCGKSLDMCYLHQQGYTVIGSELSRVAIESFAEEQAADFEVTSQGEHTLYEAERWLLIEGDYFRLSPALLGVVDAIYDRAALIALPRDMRAQYAKLLCELTANAPQLLITIEYDEGVIDGPPFSVPETEVRAYYEAIYDIEVLAREPLRAEHLPDSLQKISYLLG